MFEYLHGSLVLDFSRYNLSYSYFLQWAPGFQWANRLVQNCVAKTTYAQLYLASNSATRGTNTEEPEEENGEDGVDTSTTTTEDFNLIMARG